MNLDDLNKLTGAEKITGVKFSEDDEEFYEVQWKSSWLSFNQCLHFCGQKMIEDFKKVVHHRNERQHSNSSASKETINKPRGIRSGMMMNNQASLKSPSGVKKKIEDNSPARKLIDHEMMKSHGKSLKQEGTSSILLSQKKDNVDSPSTSTTTHILQHKNILKESLPSKNKSKEILLSNIPLLQSGPQQSSIANTSCKNVETVKSATLNTQKMSPFTITNNQQSPNTNKQSPNNQASKNTTPLKTYTLTYIQKPPVVSNSPQTNCQTSTNTSLTPQKTSTLVQSSQILKLINDQPTKNTTPQKSILTQGKIQQLVTLSKSPLSNGQKTSKNTTSQKELTLKHDNIQHSLNNTSKNTTPQKMIVIQQSPIASKSLNNQVSKNVTSPQDMNNGQTAKSTISSSQTNVKVQQPPLISAKSTTTKNPQKTVSTHTSIKQLRTAKNTAPQKISTIIPSENIQQSPIASKSSPNNVQTAKSKTPNIQKMSSLLHANLQQSPILSKAVNIKTSETIQLEAKEVSSNKKLKSMDELAKKFLSSPTSSVNENKQQRSQPPKLVEPSNTPKQTQYSLTTVSSTKTINMEHSYCNSPKEKKVAEEKKVDFTVENKVRCINTIKPTEKGSEVGIKQSNRIEEPKTPPTPKFLHPRQRLLNRLDTANKKSPSNFSPTSEVLNNEIITKPEAKENIAKPVDSIKDPTKDIPTMKTTPDVSRYPDSSVPLKNKNEAGCQYTPPSSTSSQHLPDAIPQVNKPPPSSTSSQHLPDAIPQVNKPPPSSTSSQPFFLANEALPLPPLPGFDELLGEEPQDATGGKTEGTTLKDKTKATKKDNTRKTEGTRFKGNTETANKFYTNKIDEQGLKDKTEVTNKEYPKRNRPNKDNITLSGEAAIIKAKTKKEKVLKSKKVAKQAYQMNAAHKTSGENTLAEVSLSHPVLSHPSVRRKSRTQTKDKSIYQNESVKKRSCGMKSNVDTETCGQVGSDDAEKTETKTENNIKTENKDKTDKNQLKNNQIESNAPENKEQFKRKSRKNEKQIVEETKKVDNPALFEDEHLQITQKSRGGRKNYNFSKKTQSGNTTDDIEKLKSQDGETSNIEIDESRYNNNNNNNTNNTLFIRKSRRQTRQSFDHLDDGFDVSVRIQQDKKTNENHSKLSEKKSRRESGKSRVIKEKFTDTNLENEETNQVKTSQAETFDDIILENSIDHETRIFNACQMNDNSPVRKSNRKRTKARYAEFEYSLLVEDENEEITKKSVEVTSNKCQTKTIEDEINKTESQSTFRERISRQKKAKLQPEIDESLTENVEPQNEIVTTEPTELNKSHMEIEESETNQTESHPEVRRRTSRQKKAKLQPEMDESVIENVEPQNEIVTTEPTELNKSHMEIEESETNQTESHPEVRRRTSRQKKEKLQPEIDESLTENVQSQNEIVTTEPTELNKSHMEIEESETNQTESHPEVRRRTSRQKKAKLQPEIDESVIENVEPQNEIVTTEPTELNKSHMEIEEGETNQTESHPEVRRRTSRQKKAKLQPEIDESLTENVEPQNEIVTTEPTELNKSHMEIEEGETNQTESHPEVRRRTSRQKKAKLQPEIDESLTENVEPQNEIVTTEPTELNKSHMEIEESEMNQTESHPAVRRRTSRQKKAKLQPEIDESLTENVEPQNEIVTTEPTELNKSHMEIEESEMNQTESHPAVRRRKSRQKKAKLQLEKDESVTENIEPQQKEQDLNEPCLEDNFLKISEKKEEKKISRRRISAGGHISSFVEKQKNLLEKIEREKRKKNKLENNCLEDVGTEGGIVDQEQSNNSESSEKTDHKHNKDDKNVPKDILLDKQETNQLVESGFTKIFDSSSASFTPSTKTNGRNEEHFVDELSPICEFSFQSAREKPTSNDSRFVKQVIEHEHERTEKPVRSDILKIDDLNKKILNKERSNVESSNGEGSIFPCTPKSFGELDDIPKGRTYYTDPSNDHSSAVKRRRTGPSFRAVTNLFDSLSSTYNIYNVDFSTRPSRTCNTLKLDPDKSSDSNHSVPSPPPPPPAVQQSVSVKVLEPLDVLVGRFP